MPLISPKNVDNSISNKELYRGGESFKKSPNYSPTTSLSPTSPYFMKHQDLEEDHGLYQKKSVLTKVKEKARKLRYSLSKRRMEDNNNINNVTPSWGVSLDDVEEYADAEYLGAPMYESEVAPEIYKENARQHPRANPVISDKHILHTNAKETIDQPSDTRNEKVEEKIIPAYAKVEGHAISRTPSANMASPSPSPSPSSSLPPVNITTNTKSGGALVVSEAMSSPRKAPSNNAGMMEKVIGAVNSLLGNEEPSQQCVTVKTTPTCEVGQEGNHGHFVQAN
ncbi:hypothetical protein PIB30_008263 [Stylosanthes scabra]|uniref:LTI65/LTI78 N-terminal domain-containing protein n=1 Tax=Stylosanthes scabra TaxID=79078 RepID=A0ABU6R3R6_9FABA|nr:hypothetical protein [Stylosanthes scabra]